MRWLFHYPKRIAFYPPDFDFPGIGGSEASLILLTRALASRGHHVDVYNCCWKPGTYGGVHWHLNSSISDAQQPDVAVAVRFEEAIHPCNAAKNLFWMLDDRASGACLFASTIGGIVVVSSDAQRNRLVEAKCKAEQVNIPLPVEIQKYSPLQPKERACIFCSMPNRGLDIALNIWPHIRNACPDVELWITSGWELWGYTIAEASDRWRQIVGGSQLPPGTRLFKAVSREHLTALQLRASLFLYPCRFPEMFCLAAAECSAAGTPLVTSSIEAMKERVQHGQTGILVNGDIGNPNVQREFVDQTVALLNDENRLNEYRQNCRKLALRCSLEEVATAWERVAGM
ncbi:MAG: glycosyltransferase family 4 protein [Verrucomicrobia bacterium]|nr:glycosyltransferase family 4 protein [Verrucomicrobiota bacterium]